MAGTRLNTSGAGASAARETTTSENSAAGNVALNLLALIGLALAIYITGVFGLFGIMGAANLFDLVLLAVVRTAVIPAAYFLVFHVLLAEETTHKKGGLRSAIAVVLVNAFVLFLLSHFQAMLAAQGVFSRSAWVGYAGLLIVVSAQIAVSRKLRDGIGRTETKTSALTSGVITIGALIGLLRWFGLATNTMMLGALALGALIAYRGYRKSQLIAGTAL